jgi:transposase
MAWTDIARREHSRAGLRYPSDMTDREWELMAPFVPPAKRGGRRRTTDMREVINAILYIAASGGAWQMLPKRFPAVSTVRRNIEGRSGARNVNSAGEIYQLTEPER